MKKVLLFVFPQYADFEIAHTLFFLRKVGKASVVTATIDGDDVESLGGLLTKAQLTLSDVNIEEYDLVLIPGGDGISEVINDTSIQKLLTQAYEKEIPIASICASATLLGKAGLLKGKSFTCTLPTYQHFEKVFLEADYTGSNIEVGERFITAKGTAFAEFTVAVGNLLNLWRNKEQEESVYQFCKGNE